MSDLRQRLCEAHTLAWQEQRLEDQVAILRAIWAMDGLALPRHRDTRDEFQRDFDEEKEGTYR